MKFVKSILIGFIRLLAFVCITAVLSPYYLAIMCIYCLLAAAGEEEDSERWFGYGSKVMDFTADKCSL